MQFAVPQFTDVEDQIIGPLTLKQFLSLLVTSGVILLFWSLLGFSFFFFVASLPFLALGLGLAFGKMNGRSFFDYLLPFIAFLAAPKVMIYRRQTPQITLSEIEPIKKNQKDITPGKLAVESAESRLKKLAYLLDQKLDQEKELIDNSETK